MTDERWRRLGALFDRATELPEEEQDAWLRQACAEDLELRQEVAAMLAATNDEGLLDRPFGLTAPLPPTGAEGLAPGTWVGPYQVRREIDRGGMGVVYEAHDPRLDRLVALKCLAPRLQGNPRAMAHFLSEARAAAGLDHPHICTVYELGEAEGGLFIAMALYEGQTLRRLLDAGPLAVDRAVSIALQVARGLECAHQVGVVHRDIKPSNIIVTRRGEAKILDFGIAQLDTEALSTSDQAGTPHYMSPEQAARGPVDARTDLWALGVMLYEMLTGTRPFDGSGPRDVLRAIVHEEPVPATVPRADLPAGVDAVLSRLLAKAPDRRYQSASEVVAALAASMTPPSGEGSAGAHRMPVPLTRLVGRDDDVLRVEQLVRASRLVTLTGPGGTGKTRLALAVADRMAPSFADGAAFVSLAPIADPALLFSAVAEAIDVRLEPGRSLADSLRRALEGRRMLLVLDNFEQIAAAAAGLADLLAAAPSVRALVTSRLALHVEGEQQYVVPPLALPDPLAADDPSSVGRAPAVALFIERARGVDPAFGVTADNARSLSELCARLDGLPLAIELAAANLKLLPPRQLLERMRDALDVPQRGGRDRAPRHRTLRAAIAWSYDLLSSDEQRVFRAVGAFAGGCSMESAETVCGAVGGGASIADALATLLDHSLLRQAQRPDGTPRLSMLGSIQAFALERLEEHGEAPAARRAHAEHYLALAEHAEPLLIGPGQKTWLDRLQLEHDNLRAALAWASGAGDGELALRLAAALWRFWVARGHMQEGRAQLEALVAAAPQAPDPLRLRALNGLATLLQSEGRPRAALAVLQRGLRVAEQRGLTSAIAAILNNIVWVSSELAELDIAERIGIEALSRNRELGDARGIALALSNLGWIAMYRGDMGLSLERHAEGLELRRAIGDDRGVAFALANLAVAHARAGRYRESEDCAAQSLGVLEGLHDGVLLGWTQCVLSVTCWLQGHVADARAALEASRCAGRDAGNLSVVALGFLSAGNVALAEGDPRRAAEAFTESLRLHRDSDMPWGLSGALLGLGLVAHMRRDTPQAVALVEESLDMRARMGARLGVAECHEALALIAFHQDDRARAVSLWGHAVRIRAELGTPLAPVERTALAQLLASPLVAGPGHSSTS